MANCIRQIIPKNYASTVYQSQIVDNYSEKTTDIVRRHPFPAKWRVRNEPKNSMLVTCHYLDLGSASGLPKIYFVISI